MKRIPLTQGKYALIDDGDFERVNRYKWHLNKKGNLLYAIRTIYLKNKHTTQTLHGFIVDCPKNMETDHVNGNGLNNTRKNLRIVTHSQNMMNQRGRKKIKGVTKHKDGRKNKYETRIKINQRTYHLGSYKTVKQAARAYDRAALKMFGEFARTNFPKSRYKKYKK